MKRITVKYLNDEFDKLKDKLNEMDALKERVAKLEKSLQDVNNAKKVALEKKAPSGEFKCTKCQKTFVYKEDFKKHVASKHGLNHVKCKSCDKVFIKNSDLEVHMEKEHTEVKKFKCEECDMNFVLHWRLKKHQNIHTDNNLKFCHYFNNDKVCPFADLGCMFSHKNAPHCKYQKCTYKLCQYKHSGLTERETNSCKICDYVGTSEDTLKTHLDSVHDDKSSTLTEDEQYFDLYVMHNFSLVYNLFEEGNNHIKCYHCDYISTSDILYHIQGEVFDHLNTKHKDIMESYDTNTFPFENEEHEDFFGLFVDSI